METWRARWLVALLLGCASATIAWAEDVQVVFRVSVPVGTASDAEVYLAGSAATLGGWKPNGLKLDRAEGVYTARVALPAGRPVEFKVTRGSWETVEKARGGGELANRSIVPQAGLVVNVEVATWSASVPATRNASTMTGDVRRHDRVKSEVLQNERTIWVYVPPGYDSSDERYPVLYLHDGQNVFDAATSFAGEWQADETAERLIREKKIRPILIVAVANTPRRMDEYTPTASNNRGGRGDDYAKFLIEELKPWIDRTYRTKPERRHTAVGGSSLGGLISLHVARKYPERVGMVGAMSPSLWWDGRRMIRDVEADAEWLKNARVWIDMGTAEGSAANAGRYVEDAKRFAELMEKAGMTKGRDFEFRPIEGAAHNEVAWARRFDQVLMFFFGTDPLSR